MPFRASLPKLSVKFSSYSKSSAPSIFSPPSASTPTSSKSSPPHPMTPPARLYLRNVLPTSPDSLPTPPPPPPQPRPWVWQCHSCLTIWRLASTRRCLVCSHEYCTTATATTTRPASARRGGRKQRRRNGPGAGGAYCRAEFDYAGWEEWGAWRRKVLGLEARSAQPARDRAFLRRAHDCWLDCDYPSQCHHERAQLAARRAYYYPLRTVVEEPQPQPQPALPIVERAPASRATSPDDDLQLNEALDIAQEVDQQQQQKEEGEQTSPTSPKSPLSQTSFFPESDEPEKKPAVPKKETKLWWRPVDEYKSQVTRNSPATDSRGKNSATLRRLMREDHSLMPLEYSSYDSVASSGSRGGKLMVRNSTEFDDMEISALSSDLSSSSDDDDSISDDSDDDDEYEMAESDLSSLEEDTRSTEEIERDLRLLIEASKSLSRD